MGSQAHREATKWRSQIINRYQMTVDEVRYLQTAFRAVEAAFLRHNTEALFRAQAEVMRQWEAYRKQSEQGVQ